MWFSQPFYSAPGSYKLCLRVDANGFGDGEGTHVSVFVYLMKGENDYRLQWPFQQEVTYGILNWKEDKNHAVNVAKFRDAPTEDKCRVISGLRAESGWGRPQSFPHSSLFDAADNNTQYLYQDCLCLRVFGVESPKISFGF